MCFDLPVAYLPILNEIVALLSYKMQYTEIDESKDINKSCSISYIYISDRVQFKSRNLFAGSYLSELYRVMTVIITYSYGCSFYATPCTHSRKMPDVRSISLAKYFNIYKQK